MLKPIQDLPTGISGVVAQGTVTKHDYEATLRPILQRAESEKKPVRLLYAFGPDFEGLTPAAAWADVNIAFDHIQNVERCAVVSDRTWIKAASQLAGALTPARVREFHPDDWDDAVAWLQNQDSGSSSS